MPRVTVGVARSRTLTPQWQCVPSTGQHLKFFIGNGVSIWVKNSWVGQKKNPFFMDPAMHWYFKCIRHRSQTVCIHKYTCISAVILIRVHDIIFDTLNCLLLCYLCWRIFMDVYYPDADQKKGNAYCMLMSWPKVI